jgi:hypothetical protein
MVGDTATISDAAKLREGLEAKSVEAQGLALEIERIRLEAQLLRLQLLANGIQDESVIPGNLRAGGSPEDPTVRFLEQKRLIEWLAEVCDLTSRKTCNVIGDLHVAGYKALIGHGVQWSLSVPDGLSLTIPIELESSVVGMLQKARSGLLSCEEFDHFACEWDMLSVEMCVEGESMPGLFLIRREDSTAIVVSAWPKLPPLTGSSSSSTHTFDTGKFFEGMSNARPDEAEAVFFDDNGLVNRLNFSKSGLVHWHLEGSGSRQMSELGIDFRVCEPPEFEHFSLTGPFGRVVIADPRPGALQREIVEDIVSLALEHGLRVQHAQSSTASMVQEKHGSVADEEVLECKSEETRLCSLPEVSQSLPVSDLQHVDELQSRRVSKGDSVEVQYQGEWVSGVLQGVQGEFALVSCDADDPDIITVAPLRKVRAASYDETEGEHSMKKSVSQ